MHSSWPVVRLGDLIERGALALSDGYRVRNEELGPEGIPFVRGGDIGDGWINTSTKDHVRPEFAERVASKLARPGDLAFITKGTVGRAGRLREGQPRVVFAPQVAYWRVLDPTVLDAQFLYYVVCSPAFQNFLYGEKTHGSMVADYVSISQQHAFRLPLPDIQIQRKIGRTLSTLDDKIELNRQMSETQEAMARALFKSWFVDFEPVRAKAEGRDTGLPEPIASLFPDSLEDSEVGEVPKGWIAGSFGEIASRRSERVGSREAVVLSAVASGALIRSDEHFSKRVYSEETSKYLVVEQWDFAYNPSRINIGSIGMLEESVRGGVSPVYVVFRPSPAYRWYLEFALRQPQTRAWIDTLASGSVRQSLSFEEFASIPCTIPPRELVGAFDRCWEPLRARIEAGAAESRALGEIRNTVLPELLSGRLEVDVFGRSPDEAL